MAKKGVHPYQALAISARLRSFAIKYFGSWEEFVRKSGVARTTADTWRRTKAPAVPDAAMLLRLAQKVNIDLQWLLLGHGSRDIWEHHDTDTERQLELTLEAVLRTTEDATTEEFRAAWDRLKYRGDFSKRENVILLLAAEGVRPRFQENLRFMRHMRGVMSMVNQFMPEFEVSQGRLSKKKAEEFRTLVREAIISRDPTNAPAAKTGEAGKRARRSR